MFLPLRTDRRLKYTPWVNYTLIGVNIFIFLLTRGQIEDAAYYVRTLQVQGYSVPAEYLYEQFPVLRFYLNPSSLSIYQFLSYQFLHADWMHLAGNMLFLYVFGNSVEDRYGKVGYLFFYLAGGVIAGLGHSVLESSPVLGASGAVAAVTGAYLALFPLSYVTIFYWFFIIGTFEISSMLLIFFQIGQNILFQAMGSSGVAYLAHLAGYGFGFAIGMGLLLARVLPREPYDMLALIEQKRRRATFRRLAERGQHGWEHAGPGHLGSKPAAKLTPEQERLTAQRSSISTALANHDLATAAQVYRELLEQDAQQVMGQQQQLDLANQLMAEARYDMAATAYELFLKHYTGYAQTEQIQLILGLIYARYLQHPKRAQELLAAAAQRLHGSDRDLAKQVLAEVSG